MGIWNDLRSLGGDYLSKLQELYTKRNFPWEVRGQFAEWFEEQNWNFDETNPANKPYANELLDTLLKKLDMMCSKPQEDLMSQMRMYNLKKQFMGIFGGQPCTFVSTVRDILIEEQQLLAMKSMSTVSLSPVNPVMMDSVSTQPITILPDINQSLNELKGKVMEVDVFIKEYRNRQEDFILQYQDVCKVETNIQQAKAITSTTQREQQLKLMEDRKKALETDLRGQAEQLIKDRENIMSNLVNIQQSIQMVGSRIVDELLKWRMMQQKSLSGAVNPGSLDDIQEWFENLIEIIWRFYSVTSQYKHLYESLPISKNGLEKDQIEQLLKDIVSKLTALILRSFIVEKQPPQVLKTQTKFQASVRLLVGSKLNLHMNCPEVIVSILSEKQCQELINGKKLDEIGTCGDILNQKCVMEHSKDNTTFHAEFKNLQLKKIKREDRRGQESVLEAKSALVFSAKLNISGDEMPVMCMSVPVVVVVHGNQAPNSEATIIWDNMFSSPDRKPFEVPDEVTWKEMSEALNARWRMTTERELKPEHLMYLKEKIFTNIADHELITAGTKIPWTLFNKEPLKQRAFTFWDWYYNALNVVKKNLKEQWKEGYLEFLTRQTAHAKLLNMPQGTFLIRFSDGELGAVTIAYCDERKGYKEIQYLQPWSTKDFVIRNLADSIFDLEELTHLYPDIPKEQAFGVYRSIDVDLTGEHQSYQRTNLRVVQSATSPSFPGTATSPSFTGSPYSVHPDQNISPPLSVHSPYATYGDQHASSPYQAQVQSPPYHMHNDHNINFSLHGEQIQYMSQANDNFNIGPPRLGLPHHANAQQMGNQSQVQQNMFLEEPYQRMYEELSKEPASEEDFNL